MPGNILRNNYVDLSANLPPRDAPTVLRTLDHVDLPKTEYFVIGGANLVLRGIIDETPDIDMLVSESAFEALSQMHEAIIKVPPPAARRRGAVNRSVWYLSYTQMPISATTSLGDGFYPMSFESHRDRTVRIAGIPCLKLEDVTASKEALQRKKDMPHLARIARHLGRTLNLPQPSVIDPVEIS